MSGLSRPVAFVVLVIRRGSAGQEAGLASKTAAVQGVLQRGQATGIDLFQ